MASSILHTSQKKCGAGNTCQFVHLKDIRSSRAERHVKGTRKKTPKENGRSSPCFNHRFTQQKKNSQRLSKASLRRTLSEIQEKSCEDGGSFLIVTDKVAYFQKARHIPNVPQQGKRNEEEMQTHPNSMISAQIGPSTEHNLLDAPRRKNSDFFKRFQSSQKKKQMHLRRNRSLNRRTALHHV